MAPYIDSESQFELVGNFTNNSLQEYTIKDTGWYSFYCTTTSVNDVLRVMVANRAFYLTLVGGMTFLPIKAGTVIKIGGTTQYPIIVYKCV